MKNVTQLVPRRPRTARYRHPTGDVVYAEFQQAPPPMVAWFSFFFGLCVFPFALLSAWR